MPFFRRRGPEPLSGAPVSRRQKTYQAQSGYVYEYFYEGFRHASGFREYVFSVSADRRQASAVSVFLSSDALRAWEERHGRQLRDVECYAFAKVALMRTFDGRDTPAQVFEPTYVDLAGIESIVEFLGL